MLLKLLKFFKEYRLYFFILFSVLAAICFKHSLSLFLIISIINIILSFHYKVSLLLIPLFLLFHIVLSPFHIIIDSEYKDKGNKIVLISGTLNINSSNLSSDIRKNLKPGDILYAKLLVDFKKSKAFFKPRYFVEDEVRIYHCGFLSAIMKYRKEIADRLFYESGKRVRVAQALVLGDRRFIESDIKDAYTISGLTHLLAMSGMHVGIILSIVLVLLYFLPIKHRFLVAIFVNFLLLILGGFNVTVARAIIFANILMLAYILDIRVNSERFIIAVAGFFLLFSPSSISDISFLLSFFAVFGIIYMVTNLKKNILFSSLLVGIAATLLTAPISMYVFSMTNHLSIISTVIYSPIIYMHIFISLLALLFTSAILPLLTIYEAFANQLILYISKYSYWAFILKSIPLYALIIFSLPAFFLFFKNRLKYIALLSLLVIFFPASEKPDAAFMAFSNGRSKGFVSFYEEGREIYYFGTSFDFKFNFLKAIARYGYKEYDYGMIDFTDIGENHNNFIHLKSYGGNFSDILLIKKKKNEGIRNDRFKYIYYLSSNSISLNDLNNKNILFYIIWNSSLKDERIIKLKDKNIVEVFGDKVKSIQ